jgi:hypothetical protein
MHEATWLEALTTWKGWTMRAVILAMVGSLLAPAVGAQAVECYGTGSRRLVEVGDYRTFRDQD